MNQHFKTYVYNIGTSIDYILLRYFTNRKHIMRFYFAILMYELTGESKLITGFLSLAHRMIVQFKNHCIMFEFIL